ncbi:glycine cleavage system protein R [Bacterioplanes sanyensis]|uniref:Glycine cleavage system transcriptional repressor n=1 Tax=Bacterioplanes sanyensis TaxID=1249553 RepID=A0A222FQG1_9GAMM|nr:ACT domain-containing protein [Bacterioplanes sanyensis]ASP40473.1 glycine cleavage system protein R [Bacterioplanes sanyensis]
MTISLVLTVIADDQPGIVEQVAAVVSDHQGNWLESRMAHMAGKFAGIVRVNVSENDSVKLIAALAELRESGIQVNAESTGNGDTPHERTTQDLQLSLVGNDRPGIVREVSKALANIHVNVLEFTSNCDSAEMSAVPLFRAQALLRVPNGMELDEVQSTVEALSDDLMVELGAVAAH